MAFPFPKQFSYTGGAMNARVTLTALAALLALAAVGGGTWWERSRMVAAPSDGIEADAADQLPLPPVPPRVADSPDYEHCLALLDTDPSDAAAFADGWHGGIAAAHCRALADVALGHAGDGAVLLDQIAANKDTPDAARAVLFSQAQQAWMLAGDATHALASADQAVARAPKDADLLIGRAEAEAALDQYQAAVRDLTAALESDPQRTEALVARGAARRHLNDLAGARVDLDRALAIDPDQPEALLERGIVMERAGDRDGAQRDWSRAAELAPDTQIGDLAEQNLQLLAVGPISQ
jgi:tetratricopeptide (TPR) repeat protein